MANRRMPSGRSSRSRECKEKKRNTHLLGTLASVHRGRGAGVEGGGTCWRRSWWSPSSLDDVGLGWVWVLPLSLLLSRKWWWPSTLMPDAAVAICYWWGGIERTARVHTSGTWNVRHTEWAVTRMTPPPAMTATTRLERTCQVMMKVQNFSSCQHPILTTPIKLMPKSTELHCW